MRPAGSNFAAELAERKQRAFAEAGLQYLQPLCPESAFYPTAQFADAAALNPVLAPVIGGWAPEALNATDANPYLDGGLALRSQTGDVLIEPTCCIDLETSVPEWRSAAAWRESEWREIYIGHPAVAVRYERPWLVFSQVHEHTERPEERWATTPELLEEALANAETELLRFARVLSDLLRSFGCEAPDRLALKLSGLAQAD